MSARVLLVEDDRQLLAMLDTLLTEEGYEVDTAQDGQQGLHLGLTRSCDVVVLDRGLPAIDGLDLLSRLRVRGVVTSVLVLSALANPPTGSRAWMPAPRTTSASRSTSTSSSRAYAPCVAGTSTPHVLCPCPVDDSSWTPAVRCRAHGTEHVLRVPDTEQHVGARDLPHNPLEPPLNKDFRQATGWAHGGRSVKHPTRSQDASSTTAPRQLTPCSLTSSAAAHSAEDGSATGWIWVVGAGGGEVYRRRRAVTETPSNVRTPHLSAGETCDG